VVNRFYIFPAALECFEASHVVLVVVVAVQVEVVVVFTGQVATAKNRKSRQIPSQTNMDTKTLRNCRENEKMLTTPKQTEQYGHSNSQSNKYGPAKKHYKATGKMKKC